MQPKFLKSIIGLGARGASKVFRQDGWESLVQVGMGASANASPRNWAFVAPPALSDNQLQSLFDGSWLVRKIADTYPKIATKEGLGCDDTALTAYQAFGFGPRYPDGVIVQAATLGRALGGCVVLAGFDSPDAPAVPIDPDKSAPPLLWLEVIPRGFLKTIGVETLPEMPGYKAPILFEVTDGPRKGLQFHVSRCVVFGGDIPSPKALVDKHENFWTSSVIQSLYEDLLRVGQRNAAVDRVMTRVSTASLEIEGLLEAIASDSGSDLDLRLQALAKGVETTNCMLLEKGEVYNQYSATLTGIAEPVISAIEMVAGAAGIPMTELLGRSPAGMNATGESDTRMLYSKVDAYRQNLTSKVETILSWCAGKPVKIKWPNLWAPTGAEAAELLAKQIEVVSKIDEIVSLDGEALLESINASGLLIGLELVAAPEPDPLELPTGAPEVNPLTGLPQVVTGG